MEEHLFKTPEQLKRDDRNKGVVKSFKEGLTGRMLMEKFDLSETTIRNILLAAGIEPLAKLKAKKRKLLAKRVIQYYKTCKDMKATISHFNPVSEFAIRRFIELYKGKTIRQEKQERNKKIIADLKAGKTFEEIERKLKINTKTVYHVAKKAGFDTQLQIRRRNILRDLKTTMTHQQIADRYNMHRAYVSELARVNGIRRQKPLPVKKQNNF
jgi:Mor family transcriptional regulator